MERKKISRVGDILPAVLKSIGLDQKFKEREILSIWPTVVGDEIAAQTHALKIERGVLYVQVENPVWRQELHFMEKEIYRKLREKVPEIKFHKIRFTATK